MGLRVCFGFRYASPNRDSMDQVPVLAQCEPKENEKSFRLIRPRPAPPLRASWEMGQEPPGEAPNETEPLREAADLMYSALKVILHSERLRPLLACNDPKALDQAVWACSFYSSRCRKPAT